VAGWRVGSVAGKPPHHLAVADAETNDYDFAVSQSAA